jgi:hypothetical protein
MFKEFLKFLPKKISICSQIYGFGIQGSKRHRIPDPDPQHCEKLTLDCTCALCRLAMCERQNHPGERWFADYPPAANLFRQIKDFEPDCRLFLNCLNSWLGPDQLIFSPPAIRVFIADREVFKPDDEKYSCFWVDFRY